MKWPSSTLPSLFAAGYRLVLGMPRRLLACWVKPRILPEPLPDLAPDGRTVYYVLENRLLADLLVLEQACRQTGLPRPTSTLPGIGSSVTALRRPGHWWRRRPPPGPVALARLVEAGLGNDQLDVLILPVQIFWGRAPGHEDSWLRLLAAEGWTLPGLVRRSLRVPVHGRDTWVQFGQGLSLQTLLTRSPADETRAVRILHRWLGIHFRRQRAALLGPELLRRKALVERVLERHTVRQAIQATAEEQAIPQLRAAYRARRYANEIAADFSYSFALFMRPRLRGLWERIYNGIELRHAEPLNALARTHSLVYLPCHRSHIDYLLLSYVLHQRGLAIPHIAAGINLNLPLIGPWLRRAGAFFLRRSFRGNTLYGAVLQAYLAVNLERGIALEFFIEGGRSRTGHSLPPKLGLLGMTLTAFIEHPERPVALIPVYIGYEKLVEGHSYLAELSGKPKRRESLSGLLRGLRQLRDNYGKVHVNFGQALRLPGYLDRHHPEWRGQPVQAGERPPWLAALTSSLGHELMTRINAATTVNPINLLAIVVPDAPQLSLDETELLSRLAGCRQVLADLADQDTLDAMPEDRIIAHGLDLGLIRRQPGPAGPLIQVTQAGLLAYFRNNVVHVFALPGLLASALLSHSPASAAELVQRCLHHYPRLRETWFLPWSEPELEQTVRGMLDRWQARGLIRGDAGEFHPVTGSDRKLLVLLADIVRPQLAEPVRPAATHQGTQSRSIPI